MMHSHDFFAAQRYHKKISLIFYGLFLLAVGFHALLLLVVCVLIGYVFTHDQALSYWLACLAGLGLYIVFGLAVGRYRVRLGGVGLAKKMGAVRLFVSSVQDDDKTEAVVYHPNFIKVNNPQNFPSGYARLYEFVAQMSIASGLPMPMVYVLPNQMGVNAWVAGFDETDTVMAFTQGAVDTLDNEALYGLIGHEFGHILHGDSRFNLRVYVLMTGLSWFYESVESLTGWLFEKFDRPYDYAKQNENWLNSSDQLLLNSPKDWALYWQNQPKKQRPSQIIQDLQAQALIIVLPIIGFLMLLQMVGVLGMITHDWVIHRFNRERELFADATSIQLTRSFGVLSLLTLIDKGVDTSLVGQYSTHMGLFFFVNPNAQATFFDTHPSIHERMAAINGHWYDQISSQMIAHLDKQVLKQAHDTACKHAAITPLAEELSYDEVVFEVLEDAVVDGRLMVNPAWYDWQAIVDDEPPKAIGVIKTSPQQADLSPTCTSDDVAAVLDMTYLKTVNLPWQIVKHQRQAVGALAVIEVLLLCRYDTIDPTQTVDFFDIYIKTAYNNKPDQAILPHHLERELIAAIADLDRKSDGLMVVRTAHILKRHTANQNIPISPKQRATLARYYEGLCEILALPSPKQDTWLINDFGRLIAKLDKLWQAAALALVYDGLQVIFDKKDLIDTVAKQALVWLEVDKFALAEGEEIGLVLLAFLVGVQDNSLLIRQTQPLLLSLERFLRLLGIDGLGDKISGIEQPSIEQLIYRTHQLGVVEWACLFLVLSDKPTDLRQRLHETMHTALLYDAKLSQKEMDILLMLQLLWLGKL